MNKIDTNSWKDFKIIDLFKVVRPAARSQSNYNEGDVAFVASGNFNNGVLKYLKPKENEVLDKGNCITVSPIDGSAFYQKDNFLGRGGAGSSVILLYNDNLNTYNGYFIATVIRSVCKKYAYSDMANKDRIGNEIIKLPVDKTGNPNFSYMETYMKNLESTVGASLTALQSANGSLSCKKADTETWMSFVITDFFEPVKVINKLSKLDFEDDGSVPVQSSETLNNGILGYTKRKADFLIENNEFFLIFGDHTKSTNIANYDFCVMDNVKVLRPKISNKQIAIFITTVWKKAIPDLGYARHWTVAKDVKFKLPVNKYGDPDYEYIENYMKNVERNVKKNIGFLNKV